jgi:chromosome segregation ATPase
MTRETKTAKTERLLRSGRIDPNWATITLLQERVKYLERQIRRGEKTKTEMEGEINRLEEEIDRLSSQSTPTERVRELELENQNLRQHVFNLCRQLLQLGIRTAPPLDRTFSSLELP